MHRDLLHLILYSDGFGVTKKKSISGLYLTFGNMSLKVSSMLENIFVLGFLANRSTWSDAFHLFEKELLELQSGVTFTRYDGKKVLLKAFIAYHKNDMPEFAKIGRQVGPSGDKFCRHCYISKADGFSTGLSSDSESWRSLQDQNIVSDLFKRLKKTGDAYKLRKAFGYCNRRNVFRRIYFDPIEMAPLDPYHSLLFGQVKKVHMTVYSILSEYGRMTMELRYENMPLPGSIPKLRSTNPDCWESRSMTEYLYFLTPMPYLYHGLIPHSIVAALMVWRDGIRNIFKESSVLEKPSFYVEYATEIARNLLIFHNWAAALGKSQLKVPTFHSILHLIHYSKRIGNIRLYGTQREESKNSAVKALFFSA